MNVLPVMVDSKPKVEKHTHRIWWVMRIIEMITCMHIIAGIWRHW